MNRPYRSTWGDLRNTSFSQGWLDAGGVRTRYLQSGTPDKPPLLMLHGVGGHAEAYIRNLDAHGSHFNCFAIDMLGHGWTDIPEFSPEIRHYVAHVMNVMDALNFDKACISGESLGGWVAARIATDFPDRVERLVLNTAAGSQADPVVMDKIKSMTLRAAVDPSWELVKTRLEWLMDDKTKVYDDLIATRQAIYARPGMAEGMRRTLILQEMDVRRRNLLYPEDFARIKAPTLVLWTSDDPSANVAEGRRISSMIPQSAFVVMEGCGHWPQFEDAETFNRIHVQFLLGNPIDDPAPAVQSKMIQ